MNLTFIAAFTQLQAHLVELAEENEIPDLTTFALLTKLLGAASE